MLKDLYVRRAETDRKDVEAVRQVERELVDTELLSTTEEIREARYQARRELSARYDLTLEAVQL